MVTKKKNQSRSYLNHLVLRSGTLVVMEYADVCVGSLIAMRDYSSNFIHSFGSSYLAFQRFLVTELKFMFMGPCVVNQCL